MVKVKRPFCALKPTWVILVLKNVSAVLKPEISTANVMFPLNGTQLVNWCCVVND